MGSSSPFSSILCILHAELQVLHVAAIIISLFKHVLQKLYEVRTDGEVAVFVRESASLSLERQTKWTLATRLRLLGPT